MECEFPGRLPLLAWERFAVRQTLATVPGAGGKPRLLFSRVVLRLARQQGKTFLARRLLAWRLMVGPGVFGQPQRLINTHPDGAQAVRLLEPVARGFGYQRGGKPGYSKQTFMGSWFPGGVESETDPAWMARAMTTNALTGNQGITFAYVDELQDAKDQQVTEALGGSLSGARVHQPQRWFTGTGEKPGSELLRKLKRARLRPGMCWLEWSAPPGTRVDDELGWRWASPDWSEDRAAYLREQLDELGAAEFAANFLLSDDALTHTVWLPGWIGLEVTPPGVWSSAAVESTYGSPPVVAWAARDGDRVVVSVVQAASTADAAGMVRAAGVPALVGKSLLVDAVWDGVQVEPQSATSARAVTDFRRLVDEDVLRHDGSLVLADQVAGVQVEDGPAGARVTGGRVDAIKAAVWAAQAAWAHEPWFVF